MSRTSRAEFSSLYVQEHGESAFLLLTGFLPAGQRCCRPFWVCLLSKCSNRSLPGQIAISELIDSLSAAWVSVQINRNALIRKEMNGFTQMSCNLGLQISFLKYLFSWDIPSCFLFLVVFLFRGWHVWGLLYIKNQFNNNLRTFFTPEQNAFLFTYSIQLFVGGVVCLFGVFPLPLARSVLRLITWHYLFLSEELHQQS